uniref:Uncharacterized protein n=1 Tax=Aureoumbra lagunensis TaxID=44058 RepID=A0A7S3K0F6_9STRA|mmetsp:Transcript_11724/g.17531  ORF Transcript_11724/g.17531 Transcript_11724/m.17531 type:complete len:169 (+) Transcript_11724:46-552(+)
MGRFDDSFLDERVKIMSDNPKRGKSAERYEKYKHAKILRDVIKLGGSRPDIANDVVRGFIILCDAKRNQELLAQLNDNASLSNPIIPSIPKQKTKIIKPIKKPSAPQPLTEEKKKKSEKRPAEDNESQSKKRLIASTNKRIHIFGRTVGRGRLLPSYASSSTASTAVG